MFLQFDMNAQTESFLPVQHYKPQGTRVEALYTGHCCQGSGQERDDTVKQDLFMAIKFGEFNIS